MPEQPSPNAAAVAASLKTQRGRLKALTDKLTGLGDKPVPADVAKDLAELAAAIRQSIAPTPPSATTEKADVSPKDLADEATKDLDWGRDPEGLHA